MSNIDKYKKPSVASDIVLFTIKEDEKENYRKLPEKQLSVLLVKRGIEPFKDYYALPGGFVRENETVEEAAYRELIEETGVSNVRLTNLGVFSEPDRDPRGWVISTTFIGLTNSDAVKLEAGTDAKDVKWFAISYKCLKEDRKILSSGYCISKEYELILKSGEDVLSAHIVVENSTKNYYKKTNISIKDSNGIAFDHAKLIASAIYELRNNLDSGMFAFDLMSEKFTLSDLQIAYEKILDKELLKANFRRKIADYVIETDESIMGAGHRPAKLFERNLEKFCM